MKMVKRIFVHASLSIVLVAIVGGLFGYIRYDQLAWQRHRAKEAHYMAEREYLYKLVTDARAFTDAMGRLVEIIEQEQPDARALSRAVQELREECSRSLKGLSGEVNPTSFQKDLRRPAGASPKKHERYYRILQELDSMLAEIDQENTMPPETRGHVVRKLGNEMQRIEQFINQL